MPKFHATGRLARSARYALSASGCTRTGSTSGAASGASASGLAPTASAAAWIDSGTEVTPFYDPMLAKLVAYAETREAALAREPLRKLFGEVGAHGFTLFTVEGDGSKGRRTADIQEFANIQVEVIVPPAVAEKLLQRLESEFFPKFAIP